MEIIVLIAIWIALWLIGEKGRAEDRKKAEKQKVVDRWAELVCLSKEEYKMLVEVLRSPSKSEKMREEAIEFVRKIPGLEYACFSEHNLLSSYISAIIHGRVPKTAEDLQYAWVPLIKGSLNIHVKKSSEICFYRAIESELQKFAPDSRLYFLLTEFNGQYRAEYRWKAMLDDPRDEGNEYINSPNSFYKVAWVDTEKYEELIDELYFNSYDLYSDELCDELNKDIIESNKQGLPPINYSKMKKWEA